MCCMNADKQTPQHLTVRNLPRQLSLAQLAGTWTEEEQRRFEAAIVVTEQIDEELWR